ncbi:MAG: hypothetical protein BWY10_00784 [Chloroflexi bacterium ADurb.Bin180]|nr:MAG: hypothetical protein BWY10_00784 [Chloroflexi bacterium ADurb.Bin180]
MSRDEASTPIRCRPAASVTRVRASWSLLLAVVCLALAVFAQGRFDQRLLNASSYLACGAAAVLFVVAFGGIAQEREPSSAEASGQPTATPRVWGVLLAFLAVSLLGCLDFGGNEYRKVGLILWLGGLLLALGWLYLNERLSCPAAVQPRPQARRKWFTPTLVLLLAAVAVGAWLRLYQLDIIPADIGWDLPYNYTDVLSILRGQHNIFFTANMGREGLFFYWVAFLTRFGELSHFLLKLSSALIGIATIPVLYWTGRELFSPAVGLAAAWLLAVNHWHIVLSRPGFRVILLPLFVLLFLWSVARALRRGRWFDFGLAGVAIGLGMQTYTPFFFAPVALAIALVLYLLTERRACWRQWVGGLVLMALVALVTFAPLGRYALENRAAYLKRIGLQLELVQGERNTPRVTTPLLLENVRTSLLMFNVYGDSNARFNVPGFRHLGQISALLLVPGLAYALWRWRKGSNALLLAFFLVLIAPMTLAMLPHEMPNVFRAAGTIGPALLLCALTLTAVYEQLRILGSTYPAWDLRLRLQAASAQREGAVEWLIGRRGALALAGVAIVGLFLLAEFRDTRQFYFHDFKNVLPDSQNVSIAREFARQIEAYGDRSSVYVKGWPYWFDGRALRTYLQMAPEEQERVFIDLIDGQWPLSDVRQRALFILHPEDVAGLSRLRQEFPHVVSIVHYLPGGVPGYVTVFVER